MSDIIPLPEELAQCSCRFRPQRHQLSCAVAIAFDKRPRELGKTYAAVSWDYPHTITGTFSIDIALDPVAIIKERVEQYRAFESEDPDWDKPVAFLFNLVEDELSGIWLGFGDRRQSWDHSSLEGLEADWGPEDTERLEAALAAMPDPNQGVLGLES